MGLKIKGWVNVTSGDTDALKVLTTFQRPKVSSLYIGRHRCPWACLCCNWCVSQKPQFLLQWCVLWGEVQQWHRWTGSCCAGGRLRGNQRGGDFLDFDSKCLVKINVLFRNIGWLRTPGPPTGAMMAMSSCLRRTTTVEWPLLPPMLFLTWGEERQYVQMYAQKLYNNKNVAFMTLLLKLM